MSWVPSIHEVYSGVSGLVKPGGRYRVDFLNAANHFMEWDGEHYQITKPYSERMWQHKDGAFDFRHYFGEIFNGLMENQFSIELVDDHFWTVPDLSSTPGSWSHEMAYNVGIVVVARKHA